MFEALETSDAVTRFEIYENQNTKKVSNIIMQDIREKATFKEQKNKIANK